VKVRENQLPHSRFGIIVGMKVSKNAAERNLVKRRLREILRKRLAEIKSGHDVMVMASAQALGKSYQILEADVVTALKKAGMLKTT
jgi:ribonuclease P protein component